MKKWNNGSFNRTKLATAVAVVSLGLMAGGCGSDGDRSVSTSTSTTAGGVTQITAPKGSVTGHVQDTNGNPIAGATVNVAGQSVTTDASGQYYIESVQVVGVTGADGPVAGGALQVVVQAPGHLGATVTVNPRAQIDGTPGDSNGTVNQNVGNVNNNTTFVDGFLAAAGTTVLPKLAATVTGNLRDGRTGEALVGHTVSLDFQARLQPTTNQSQAINGVAVSYAVNQNWQATTGANGLFTISGLPEDSAFSLAVQSALAAGGVGYTVMGITNPGDIGGLVNANAQNFGTTNEGIAQILGTVTVMPIVSTDARPPVVASVATVKNPYDPTLRAPDPSRAGQVAARPAGALNDDEVQTIRVHFSEVMTGSEIDENSVVIWNSTLGQYETGFTLGELTTDAIGASVLTITFDNAFPLTQANFLEVMLLVDDFSDTAGNLLTTAETFTPGTPVGAGTFNGVNNIAFDNINPTAKATYVRLDICTFLETPTGAAAVTPTQLPLVGLDPAVYAGTGTSEIAALTTYSGAFNDVEDTRNLLGGGNQIDQLNVAEAGARLTALGTALQGAAAAVNVDRGLVTFTVPADGTAAGYQIRATQGGALLNVTLATPNLTDADAAANTVRVNGPAAGTPIEVLVGPGAVAGQTTVTVTPLDGFGNTEGTVTPITLVDNVQPTVILQSAHGLAGTVGAGLVTPFGDGAEITSPGQAAQLSPAWRVNPGHFTESRTTDTPLAQALENASNVAMTRAGSANGGDNINIVYDRTAYVARTGSQGFTSAVSVSESLGSAALALNNGTATISGVAVQNDVTQSVWVENGNLQNIPGDLIRFSVNDIEAMAASHGAQLDATGSVDLAGNTAAASAFATVVDNFPPLVTSAVYSATGLTVDFNEALAPLASQVAGASLVVRYEAGNAQNIPLNQAGVVCATTAEQTVQLQNNSTRLFFSGCYLQAVGFNYNNAFTTNLATSPLGNYTEAAYGLTQTNNRHTSLVWSSIRDARLNSWASVLPTDTADPNPNFAGCTVAPAGANCLKWTGLGTNPAAGGAGTGQSPIFALIDGLGPFQILQANANFTTTTGNPAAPTNTGSFVLTFSHPFYVSQNNTVNAAGNAEARLALSSVANAANPANTNTTISPTNCGDFFSFNSATANSDFGGTGANAGAANQSTCTVTFAETGTATSSGGTSSSFTLTVTKRTTGGANANLLVADEVRVRTGTHIFMSSLTRETDSIAVSPAN